MKFQAVFIFLFLINQVLFWFIFRGKIAGVLKQICAFLFILTPLIPIVFNQPRFELDYFWWRVSGPIAIILGLIFIYLGWKEFKRAGVSILDHPKKLVDSGIYAHIRHPQYLGLIFIFVGWWWIWAAVYTFYFGMFILALVWIQGYLEETLILAKSFGNKFKDYKSKTGMFWIK